MKYTCSLEINLSLRKTAQLWNDETHFSEWQDGFQSIELISGTKDAVGAKSRILFDGKQRMELIETVLISKLPNEKKASYEHIHMSNTQHTEFKVINPNTTLFTSTVEYTQFNKLMIRIFAKLFPKVFKKQSERWMEQFKRFAENYQEV
ncbi:MAG: SRPBCC family protein [Crocinitomicaceae bacterium]|nr:SRPBCC family protein [Crocinitomicaceae bacterium]